MPSAHSRIILFALAWQAASALAGDAYQCTAADGAVTLAEDCPPGTVTQRYLGETTLPARPDLDRYDPYSVMEQTRRLDAQRAVEREAAAAARAADGRADTATAAPPPAPTPATSGLYDRDSGYLAGGGYQPGPRVWPWGADGGDDRPYPAQVPQGSGHAIHPESADSNLRPGYGSGMRQPAQSQRPDPRNSTLTPNYGRMSPP